MKSAQLLPAFVVCLLGLFFHKYSSQYQSLVEDSSDEEPENQKYQVGKKKNIEKFIHFAILEC